MITRQRVIKRPLPDLLEHDDLVRVPDPGVEDPARVVGAVLQVVVHAPGQHLLGEGHHVSLEPEMLVRPHLTRAPAPVWTSSIIREMSCF